MADNSRLEDLRRRVQQDPSSIAFAQLAEEYRRAGQLQDAVDVCRAGLAIHPAYLSARVTLGRALLDLQELEDAQQEFEQVLKSAPENLAAIRGLAEIHHRRGALVEALVQYRAALAIARNDPDLEQTVSDLEHQLEPKPMDDEGLSFEEVRAELLVEAPVVDGPSVSPPVERVGDLFRMSAPASPPAATPGDADSDARGKAARTIAALEQWLQAIHVARVERHA